MIDQAGDRFTTKTGYSQKDGTKSCVEDRFRSGRSGAPKCIPHYGLLAPATKGERLSRARALLPLPRTKPQAVEDAQTFMRRVAALDTEICPR